MKINTISFQVADTLKLPVFITNAKSGELEKATLATRIVDLNGNVYYDERKNVKIYPLSSHPVDSLIFIVPQEANINVLLVRLELMSERNELKSCQTYTFGINDPVPGGKQKSYLRPMYDAPTGEKYFPYGDHEAYLHPMLNAPEAEVSLSVNYRTKELWGEEEMSCFQVRVKNISNVPALFVQLKSGLTPDEIYFRDNFMILLPGEERKIDVLVSEDITPAFDPASISVDGWNIRDSDRKDQ